MKRLRSCAFAACYMAAYWSPVYIAAACLLVPEGVTTALLWAALFAALGALISALPGRWRVGVGVPAALLSLLAMLFLPGDWPRLIYPPLCMLVFFAALRQGSRPVGEGYTAPGALRGVGLHAVGGIAMYFAKVPLALSMLSVASPVFLLMVLLIVNEHSMRTAIAARAGGQTTSRLYVSNRLLVGVFAGISLIVIYIERLRDAADWAWREALFYALQLFAWLSSLLPFSETPSEGGGGEMDMSAMLPPAETREPGMFALIIEQIIRVVAIAVAVAGVLYLLYRIGKLIYKLIRNVLDYMSRFAQQVGEEYQDEKESLLDWEEVRRNAADAVRNRWKRLTYREKPWEQMDARERVCFAVRTLYRKAISKHPELPYQTARQALRGIDTGRADGDALADAYDRARYSQQEITEREEQEARKAVRT